MVMVKPAHASGTVAKPPGTNYLYVGHVDTGGDGTRPTPATAATQMAVCNGIYTDPYAMTPCLGIATGYLYQDSYFCKCWFLGFAFKLNEL